MSEGNNEKSIRKPAAGFDTHPENINKNGRPPKGHSITEIIKDMMDKQPKIKKALGAKILKLALAGDITAIKTIWAYLDGLPVQRVDTTLIPNPTPILPTPDVSNNDSPPENTDAE